MRIIVMLLIIVSIINRVNKREEIKVLSKKK